jgi:hypothetical protein
MSDEHSVEFEIECYEFPCAALSPYAHLRLGIQERHAVKQDVPCTACEARFRFSLQVVMDPDGSVTFRGPCAQGPRDARFVYLCWGARSNGGWEHFRRAKLPLGRLDAELLQKALRESRPIRVRVRMTDAHGEPVAATLKPEQVEWLV